MQALSFDLLKNKLRRYPHLNKIKLFVDRIEKDTLKFILLYGSLAKGTYTQYSDIDVLCIFNRKFSNLRERFLVSYKYSEGLIQTKTLSYDEFKDSIIQGNSFLHSILQKGIILYNKIPEDTLQNWIVEGKKKLNVKYFSPS